MADREKKKKKDLKLISSPLGKLVYGFFYNFFKYRVTRMGRYLLILAFFLPLFGGIIYNSTFLMYLVVAYFALIFFLTPIFRAATNPKLEVDVITPTRVAKGSIVPEEVRVKNTSRRNAYFTFIREERLPDGAVAKEEQGVLIPFLEAGEEIDLRLNVEMTKRGHYTLKYIRIESSFPSGVFKSGFPVLRERNVLVYPHFEPILKVNIPAGRRLQPGGIALASDVGESTEFLGTREFRDGDDPRYIHWKSWARLGKPIIKEFQQEYFTRIAIFIDTYPGEDPGDEEIEAFESSLSLTASISDYLERQEYIIDIIAAGPEIFYLQAGRSLAYLDQILDILAVLGTCDNKPYEDIAPHLMNDLRQISTVVVMLLGWDEERKKFLLAMKELGVEMKAFLVTNDQSSIDVASIEDFMGEVTIVSSEDVKRGFEYL